jgi:hypothetical protein
MKEDSRVEGPWEYGEWIAGGQGRRTDLLAITRKIRQGATELEIADSNLELWFRSHRAVSKYKELVALERKVITERRKLTILCGDPGTGKTSWCHFYYPDSYCKNSSKWWDGYDGTAPILLDDYTGWIPYQDLLKLLDRHPWLVEVKGGTTSIRSDTVNITSNLPYERWYTGGDLGALERRIDKIMIFKKITNELGERLVEVTTKIYDVESLDHRLVDTTTEMYRFNDIPWIKRNQAIAEDVTVIEPHMLTPESLELGKVRPVESRHTATDSDAVSPASLPSSAGILADLPSVERGETTNVPVQVRRQKRKRAS